MMEHVRHRASSQGTLRALDPSLVELASESSRKNRLGMTVALIVAA